MTRLEEKTTDELSVVADDSDWMDHDQWGDPEDDPNGYDSKSGDYVR